MFKNILFTLVLCAAANSALAAKIIVFSAQEVMLRSDLAQQKIQAYQATPEFLKMKANLEGLGAELAIMDKERKTKSMTWSEEEKTAHLKKMEETYTSRNAAGQNMKAQENALLGEISKELEPKLTEVIRKYVEDNKVDIVLRREAVEILVNSELDATQDIIAELNKLK